MKRIYTLVIVLSIASGSFAQNYQCLQADSLRYYINGYGYLRAIHLDSVVSSGNDIIYYPFRTSRGPYDNFQVLDTNGGSWVGKQVVQQQDGTFFFDNWWGDTVAIRSQANVGDSWIFYHDTSSYYYKAELTGVDTMTVLNMPDSVKHILITAWDGANPALQDSLNNFEILLSKDHGFVQVFDLYMFPYHPHDSTYAPFRDYFMDHSLSAPDLWPLVGTSPGSFAGIFKLTSYSFPPDSVLFGWNPGDEFEYNFKPYQPEDFNDPPLINAPRIDYYSILGKFYSGAEPYFVYNGWESIYLPWQMHYSFDPLPIDTGVSYFPAMWAGQWIPQENPKLIPEDHQNTFYYYYPQDTSRCLKADKYMMIHANMSFDFTQVNTFEPSLWYAIYKTGLGATDAAWYSTGDGSGEGNRMLYYRKNGDSCTEFIMPDTNNIPMATALLKINTVQVYPNPADQSVFVNLPGHTQNIAEVTLHNTLEQLVYSEACTSEKLTIDTKDLPAGLYYLQISREHERTMTKKVMIRH